MKKNRTFETQLDYPADLPLTIEYEVEPGEPMVMYYPDGSGHPGSPAGAIILKVWLAGIDITAALDAAGMIEDLEEYLMETVDCPLDDPYEAYADDWYEEQRENDRMKQNKNRKK